MQGLNGISAVATANNNVDANAAYQQANQALQQGNAVVVQFAPGQAVNAIQGIANIPGVTKVTYIP